MNPTENLTWNPAADLQAGFKFDTESSASFSLQAD